MEAVLVLQLYSPESSGEADVDTIAAAAGGGAEGSELYQSEDGKHINMLLPVKIRAGVCRHSSSSQKSYFIPIHGESVRNYWYN